MIELTFKIFNCDALCIFGANHQSIYVHVHQHIHVRTKQTVHLLYIIFTAVVKMHCLPFRVRFSHPDIILISPFVKRKLMQLDAPQLR